MAEALEVIEHTLSVHLTTYRTAECVCLGLHLRRAMLVLHPQTYETMKALLVSLPCAAQRAYSRATRGQLLPSLATHADLSLSSTGDSDSQGSPVDSPGHSVMMRQRTASHVVHARQQVGVSGTRGLPGPAHMYGP